MEEIYINVEYPKPSSQTPAKQQQGSTSSKKMHHLGVMIGLLNVLLLIGLIVLGVRSHDLASDFSTIQDNLTESLDQLSFMTEERNLLNTNLTEMSKELNRIQVLLKNKVGCPRGWTMFVGSCYLLSTKSGSWDEGRKDCRNQGADLVVIGNDDEQTFISTMNNNAWIGLTDKETEGSWKWVDGTPLHLEFWLENQPDNGGISQQWGEEDCAHTSSAKASWNDLSCSASKMWICEKLVT